MVFGEWTVKVLPLLGWSLFRSVLEVAAVWYTPVGGAYRPPTLSSLVKHRLLLPASLDSRFLRKDFVPLFDVRARRSCIPPSLGPPFRAPGKSLCSDNSCCER